MKYLTVLLLLLTGCSTYIERPTFNPQFYWQQDASGAFLKPQPLPYIHLYKEWNTPEQ